MPVKAGTYFLNQCIGWQLYSLDEQKYSSYMGSYVDPDNSYIEIESNGYIYNLSITLQDDLQIVLNNLGENSTDIMNMSFYFVMPYRIGENYSDLHGFLSDGYIDFHLADSINDLFYDFLDNHIVNSSSSYGHFLDIQVTYPQNYSNSGDIYPILQYSSDLWEIIDEMRGFVWDQYVYVYYRNETSPPSNDKILPSHWYGNYYSETHDKYYYECIWHTNAGSLRYKDASAYITHSDGTAFKNVISSSSTTTINGGNYMPEVVNLPEGNVFYYWTGSCDPEDSQRHNLNYLTYAWLSKTTYNSFWANSICSFDLVAMGTDQVPLMRIGNEYTPLEDRSFTFYNKSVHISDIVTNITYEDGDFDVYYDNESDNDDNHICAKNFFETEFTWKSSCRRYELYRNNDANNYMFNNNNENLVIYHNDIICPTWHLLLNIGIYINENWYINLSNYITLDWSKMYRYYNDESGDNCLVVPLQNLDFTLPTLEDCKYSHDTLKGINIGLFNNLKLNLTMNTFLCYLINSGYHLEIKIPSGGFHYFNIGNIYYVIQNLIKHYVKMLNAWKKINNEYVKVNGEWKESTINLKKESEWNK